MEQTDGQWLIPEEQPPWREKQNIHFGWAGEGGEGILVQGESSRPRGSGLGARSHRSSVWPQSHAPLVGPLTKGLDGSSRSPVQPSVLP